MVSGYWWRRVGISHLACLVANVARVSMNSGVALSIWLAFVRVLVYYRVVRMFRMLSDCSINVCCSHSKSSVCPIHKLLTPIFGFCHRLLKSTCLPHCFVDMPSHVDLIAAYRQVARGRHPIRALNAFSSRRYRLIICLSWRSTARFS